MVFWDYYRGPHGTIIAIHSPHSLLRTREKSKALRFFHWAPGFNKALRSRASVGFGSSAAQGAWRAK